MAHMVRAKIAIPVFFKYNILMKKLQNSMPFQIFQNSQFHQNGAYDYIALTRQYNLHQSLICYMTKKLLC